MLNWNGVGQLSQLRLFRKEIWSSGSGVNSKQEPAEPEVQFVTGPKVKVRPAVESVTRLWESRTIRRSFVMIHRREPMMNWLESSAKRPSGSTAYGAVKMRSMSDDIWDPTVSHASRAQKIATDDLIRSTRTDTTMTGEIHGARLNTRASIMIA